MAGDAELAGRFRAEAEARVYPERLDPETVPAVRRAKAWFETRPRPGPGATAVKLGPGGLRDIEFAVQLLQPVHGRYDPALAVRLDLVALDRSPSLAGFVGRADAAQLAEAYRFRAWSSTASSWPANAAPTPSRRGGGGGAGWPAPSATGTAEADALERFEADRRRYAGAVRGLHEKLFYRPLLEAFWAVPAGLDPEGASASGRPPRVRPTPAGPWRRCAPHPRGCRPRRPRRCGPCCRR